MDRLPFDPSHAHGADDPPPAARRERRYRDVAEAHELSVTELATLIGAALDERVPRPIRVVGEIGTLKTPNHWYFTLKDDESAISCVAWASTARRLKHTPSVGEEVVITGRVSFYGVRGQTQVYVDALEPVGAGALELQFKAMCEELRRLGYFEESRKRRPPVFPRRIGVITSGDGAALHDVLRTASERCRAVGIVLLPVRVQGEGAAEEVARAIRWADRHRADLGLDALLVTRGGGSKEDLWAFNERVVADAAYECVLPLVAAIGHESDTSVIELVADVRASTPTQAAVRLVPSADELRQQVDHLESSLVVAVKRRSSDARTRLDAAARHVHHAMRMRLAEAASRLERLVSRFGATAPVRVLAERRQRVAMLEQRLQHAMTRRLDRRDELDAKADRLHRAASAVVERERQRVTTLEQRLEAVDPRRVLARGFSLTRRADGGLVRAPGDAPPGASIVTVLADGEVRSTVDGGAPRRRRVDENDRADQMDLFGETE